MSRAGPPFPASNGLPRRAKSPANGLPNNPFPAAGIPTQPLTISRGATRPTTPTSSSKAGNPSRPMRSDLRTRQISQYSSTSSRANMSDIVTVTSDSTDRQHYNSDSSARRAEAQEMSPTSPTLTAAAAAFQSAGASRRALINGESERAGERERERAREKERQKRIRDKVQTRKAHGKGRAGDIDAVLDQISDEWDFVIDPDFNPVDLALALLDGSSVGKDMDSFKRTKRMLGNALKGTVDKHYQSFAAALPHHTSLLSSLSTTQSQIKDARSTLQEAKDALGNKRADLVQLWTRGQTVEEMLRLLDQIEQLKSVPDRLESLMSEKRLLQAAVLLVRSLKTISRPDMLEVGALADLRSYLLGQETALKEILVEELHGHLYLKTFWCESRWSPYIPGQQTLPVVEYEKNMTTNGPVRAISLEMHSRPQRMFRFINDLMIRANEAPVDASEELDVHRRLSAPTSSESTLSGSSNIESDSFAYMETLLESLAVLGELGNGLDTVAQRLPVEIYSLLEGTIDEVNERAEFNKRMSLLAPGSSGRPSSIFGGLRNLTLSGLRLTSFESSAKAADQETLRDLFWTLYSKLDAVLQGMRVIYEVANRIGSRRDFKDLSGAKPGALFPLVDLWPSVQSEMRMLLHDYLTDEERGIASGRNPISSINEVLREGRVGRDRNKPIFRFGDTDSKLIVRTLKRHEDELTRVLKETVPGLVQGPSDQSAQSVLVQSGPADDRFVDAGHHRVLIKPDAFHVSVLFQPTLVFLDRVVEILPAGVDAARASSVFLDEFVLNVYLPQLEEKVQSVFQSAVSDPDAFQPDTFSSALSLQPLVKASTQLTALINSLCAMLRKTPFHRENYSRLILGVIIQFYQQCSDHFRDLVSRMGISDTSEMSLSTSAIWAQRPEVTACMSAINACSGDDLKKKQSLSRQEARIELELLGNASISFGDLITPNRKLTSLGHLYRSLTWFTEQLTALKSVTDEPVSPGGGDVIEPQTARTPFTPRLPMIPPISIDEPLKLPLTRAMALRFDALLRTYEQLAEMVLFTFRTEIRCRAIHYLSLSIRRGNYQLEVEPIEPDPHIVELNIEIGKCDDAAVASLPERERRFVFEGLGSLMEQVLISGSRQLRVVNEHGVKKILRNVVALQQNLKTLTDGPRDTGLERAKQYYGLYSLTPSEMMKGIKAKKAQFTFEEYRSMLNFQCGVDQSLGDSGAAQAADRDYNMHLIELHGLAIGDIMGES